MCRSMPYLCAVVLRYSRMWTPSATPSFRVHGSNGKDSVKMLLSERTPGYRNRSQVPPIRSRRSKTVYVMLGLRSVIR